MPDTITPISALDTVGLNKDRPPVSLPPNAFTDALNVRFRHGAVSKLNGEKQIDWMTPEYLGYSNGEFIFITEWTNPNLGDNNSYYIIVVRDQVNSPPTDYLFLVKALPGDLTNPEYNEIGSTTNLGKWQSTLFQGGFSIILNNGIDIPYYLIDTEEGIAFADFELKEIPGWDSYFGVQKILDVTRDQTETGDATTGPVLSLGRLIDFTTEKLLVEAYQTDGTLRGSIEVTGNNTYSHGGQTALFVATDTTTNTTTCTPEYDGGASNSAIDDGERFVVYSQSLNTLDIRANLVKSFGDILIAGDLRVIDTGNNATIKQLPGLIRTSNIANPGALPTNWNPYSTSANTADEIQLSSSGIVRDMVTLNSQMIIYTDRSIHALNKTNNPTLPFSVTNITESYGATTLDSVIEFDGRHLVVGNNDLYLFTGNAGSIQSIAEGKVRDFFYRDLNAEYIDNLFIFRNSSKDEIWINYPEGVNQYPNKTLIWNYKTGVFTIRKMSEMRSGFSGRIAVWDDPIDGGDSNTGPANTETPKDEFVSTANGGDSDDVVTAYLSGDDASIFQFDPARRYPIFCDSIHVYFGEVDDIFIDHEGNTYESRISRIELPMTPEFDSEQLNSIALWTERDSATNIDLSVYVQTHNVPTGDDVTFLASNVHTFTIGEDYKVDVRAKGRFFDYVVTDKPTASSTGNALYWSISGMQTKVAKAGAR
jgi:hypothetical protein